MNKREKLFEKFPPVTTEKWMEKITADLKGADFTKRLVWKTREGFDVMPFYRQEDTEKLHYKNILPGEFPFVRGSRITNNEWLVRQDITVTDFKEANARALDILMKGVTSLGFIIANREEISEENISLLLKDIHCESVELNFVTAGKAKELLATLISVMKTSGTDLSKVHGTIAADPLGRLLTNSKLCVSIEEGIDYLADLVKDSTAIPGLRCVQAGGTLFSNAGAGVVMELACTLSLANEYLASLTSRGITPDVAASKIKFSFGIGPEFFPESAKLRAARMLWAIIVKGYKPKSERSSLMNVHSVTGRWNKTLYDPYVNMLRTQTEAMSAVIGGADSITVEPFDTVFGTPDEFSERIARNQQLLLKEESHFDMVADPGAGSYYLEKLTSLIASQAWKLFIETENEGGFLEAVKMGSIQKKIKESLAARKSDIARRREILLGTNQYPDFIERHTPKADLDKVFGDAAPEGGEVEPITATRGASEFEKLRIATERSGRRPLAFMLPIGNFAMRRARSQFSSNFFACAGYEVRDNKGFETAEEGVNAAMEARADIIVICSSDDDYAIVVYDIFTLTDGRALVVVAGTPPGIDNLKSGGIEHFISIRSNVLETLQMFNKKLGIN
ncbi:MAG TPA: methylmalonyl-CoA mutase family protein [Bacteroidales bacterium]|nr:methylmalonyl-CoA mutase family protein [Bacteroidales bacterium]